ncbi:MFS transporter [Mesorhizobium sp. M4A.F.Ca.ET.050.02.1.1]|uniref:MFS transporter n=1 Tax=Mesorhizobium sp. M4A.F.Ca.ET.050.02.1.1 TaxID=2496754 RepID=UPI0032AFEB8A
MVAENYSLTLALESSAGALLLVAATGLLVPIRQWKEADQDSLGFETPALALELKSRSGPIVVKIEYHTGNQSRSFPRPDAGTTPRAKPRRRPALEPAA